LWDWNRLHDRPVRAIDRRAEAVVRSPADFRTLIAEEIQKWAKVIRAANIKAE
jgi:hypothetical protein